MNKVVSIGRKYQVAPYESLDVFASVGDIPDNLVLDQSFANRITYLLLLQAESVAYRYEALTNKLKAMEGLREQVQFLEEEKAKTIAELEKQYHISILETKENGE